MAYHLGIDVGGTKVALRAEYPDGTVREAGFRWPRGTADPVRDLDLLVREVRELCAGAPDGPAGVGVALPATLDAKGVVTAWPNRPAWNGLDVGGALRDALAAADVVCADDGDLAALAEAHAAGLSDLLYLGVGTGIGGGVVLGGRLLPGPALGSCEIGHLIVDHRSGQRCDCGRRGCVQSVASGPALLRAAARARGAEVAYEELVRGFADGAPWATGPVGEGCAALAAAAVGVCELLHPMPVVVGGGFADGLPGLTDMLAARTALLARPGHPAPAVRPARLGGLSSLHGAVLLARTGNAEA